MNNQTKTDQLEREIHIGEKAAKAYTLWVKDYINTQQTNLFEEFKEANLDEYPYIHFMVIALTEMDNAIKLDIQTGDLARKQLKGE